MATLPEQIAVIGLRRRVRCCASCTRRLSASHSFGISSSSFSRWSGERRRPSSSISPGRSCRHRPIAYVGPGLATPLHVLAYLRHRNAVLCPAEAGAPSKAGCATQTASGRRRGCNAFRRHRRRLAALPRLSVLRSVRNGSIPLFAHIERFVYTAQYAGTATGG